MSEEINKLHDDFVRGLKEQGAGPIEIIRKLRAEFGLSFPDAKRIQHEYGMTKEEKEQEDAWFKSMLDFGDKQSW